MTTIRERAEKMLTKEIDPIFKEVAELLEKGLKDSKYMPWIMERLVNIDQARILLALPDTDRDESLGRHDLSEQFAKKLDMDMDTLKKHIRYLYENGMAFPTRVGPQPPRGMGQWIDTQNHPDHFKTLGDEYYALISSAGIIPGSFSMDFHRGIILVKAGNGLVALSAIRASLASRRSVSLNIPIRA